MLEYPVRKILPPKDMVGSSRCRLRPSYGAQALPCVLFRLRLEKLMRHDCGTRRFGVLRTITLQFLRRKGRPVHGAASFPWLTWRSAIPEGPQKAGWDEFTFAGSFRLRLESSSERARKARRFGECANQRLQINRGNTGRLNGEPTCCVYGTPCTRVWYVSLRWIVGSHPHNCRLPASA